MLRAEARDRLLAQHDKLRSLLREAQEMSAGLASGTHSRAELERAFIQLRERFMAHNSFEQSVLEPMLLASSDGMAPARVQRMIEEHTAEHAAIESFFARPLDDMIRELPDLVEDVDAHMAAEERTILSRAVLTDPAMP